MSDEQFIKALNECVPKGQRSAIMQKIKSIQTGAYQLVPLNAPVKLNSQQPSSQRTKGRPKGALGKVKLSQRDLSAFEHATSVPIRKRGRPKNKVRDFGNV